MLIQSIHLRFLDILSFFGKSVSLREYLKGMAHLIQTSPDENCLKMYFPYEIFTKHTLYSPLPEYEDFWDSMNGVNQLNADFAKFQKLIEGGKTETEALKIMKLKDKPLAGPEFYTQLCSDWNKAGITNMKDLAISYSISDILPLMKAIEIEQENYHKLGIDPFPMFCSISGLAFHVAIKKGYAISSQRFYLPDKQLYDIIKRGIIGGPSLVFRRYCKVDSSKIRPYEFGPEAKTVKIIETKDANALYTKCLRTVFYIIISKIQTKMKVYIQTKP